MADTMDSLRLIEALGRDGISREAASDLIGLLEDWQKELATKRGLEDLNQDLVIFRHESRQELAEFRQESKRDLEIFRQESRQGLKDLREDTRRDLEIFRHAAQQDIKEETAILKKEVAILKKDVAWIKWIMGFSLPLMFATMLGGFIFLFTRMEMIRAVLLKEMNLRFEKIERLIIQEK